MSSDGLDARVKRLEDLEALAQLKHRYAALCDDSYDADGLAQLFTEDAIWDGGAMGRAEGREAIRELFSQAAQRMPFAIHHVSNPILEIDGDRARGRWYLWQPCVAAGGQLTEDDQALWMAGRYEDRCVRRDGGWLFSRMKIELRMLSPYEAGWARLRLAEVPG